MYISITHGLRVPDKQVPIPITYLDGYWVTESALVLWAGGKMLLSSGIEH
jgi:hypothetical protein